ncbi:hypothetical protein G4O51_04015 [Candidatus Bathyarchaeota archaeon A05DMB-2]|nr:hypothetical protein [Candidatus Bathyarchaeota archaeon A05DMB-2]
MLTVPLANSTSLGKIDAALAKLTSPYCGYAAKQIATSNTATDAEPENRPVHPMLTTYNILEQTIMLELRKPSSPARNTAKNLQLRFKAYASIFY